MNPLRCRLVVVLCGTLWVGSRVTAEDVPQRVLFDFQQSGLSTDWAASGKIQIMRAELPEPPKGEGALPAGHGLKVQTEGRAGFFSRPGRTPDSWPQTREISLWVYRSPEESQRQAKSTMEVQFLEKDGRSRFWRRVELDHQGWKRVTLPLAWFRWGGNHVPRWKEVDRLGLYFRDKANVWVDNIGTLAGDEQQGAEPTDEQLLALAFPGKAPGEIKRARNQRVCVLSDAPDLDAAKLAGHLAQVAHAIQADLPFLPVPATPPRMFVFSTREAYQAFTPRLAEQMASQGAPPKSDGFTIQGMATSYWDARLGTLRPVYTHEFVHAWVGQAALLDNRSEWFHEGLATVYQLQFHPEANVAGLVQRSIADSQAHLPLEKLASGVGVPLDRYWQAGTLVELLLTHDRHKAALEKLIHAFQASGSTDLGPQLQPVLSTNWENLTADWLAHCRRNYGGP